ncbi:FecCD family ABC transporter permease [Nocardia brasiliensis]
MRLPALIAGCLVALALLLTVALTWGEVAISPWKAIAAAFGVGAPGEIYLVQQFRAPRAAVAMITGAGLAIAGAVLQRLFRNPLASPDVVGVTGGASLGAVFVLAAGASQFLVPLGALVGGLGATILLLALARGGGLSVTRLVLVGVAVQAGLVAVVNLLIVRFPLELAGSAMQWVTGSCYGRTWTEVAVAALGSALATALLFTQHRTLAVLDLGDESAAALGVTVARARLRLVTTAAVVAALAVALAGPIAFVALAVPNLVRLLTGPVTAGTLALTGMAGAILLLICDLLTQHVLPVSIPVGAVTATIGAPWLLYFLSRASGPLRDSAT